MNHWARHPHVRTGSQLTFGERAADKLKAAFGSWMFLITLNVFIVAWIALNAVLPSGSRWDVFPFILLNLGLSWLAAQQGGALQIAANRGDRIASEVALGTHQNSENLIALQEANTDLTRQVHELATTIAAQTCTLDELHRHLEALTPQAGQFPAPPAVSPPAAPRSSRKRT